MKIIFANRLIDVLNFFRFVVWYLMGIATIFYLLPRFGIFLEGKYDDLTNSVKVFSVIGFFAIIAIWQLATLRKRL